MILTHDILEIIIGYLPQSSAVHLQGTPFEDYAFNQAFSEVEVSNHSYDGCGSFIINYEDLNGPEDYTNMYMVRQGIRQGFGSSASFNNVYSFRRFLEEHPRYRPRSISFESHRDLILISNSHPHILREAQIHYSEETIYDDEGIAETPSKYIGRMNDVLALPCQFKSVYFEQLGETTWGSTTFKIPESVSEVTFFAGQNSHSYFRGFVESLASLSLTKMTLHHALAPPPLLFSPSLRILRLSRTILPERFCMDNMPNLRELILGDDKNTCESLDLSGLSIVKLELRSLGVKSLEKVAFPQTLRELLIQGLPHIQDFSGLSVSLTHLKVMYCPKIERLEFPDTLRKLELKSLGDLSYFDSLTPKTPEKFIDHRVKLPKNLSSLCIGGWGNFQVQGTLELPPMLTDLHLDQCQCSELPRLPDSIEFLQVHTRGIKSLEGVVWPRNLVSLSVQDSELDVFPCHSLLGLDRLQGVFVQSQGNNQKRFERALKTGEVTSIVKNLGEVRLAKEEEKEMKEEEEEEIYEVVEAIEIDEDKAASSLSSLQHLIFSQLKMVFREGRLVRLSCPVDLNLTRIPETVEMFQTFNNNVTELIPSSLKELDFYSIDFEHAQEFSEHLPQSMERLSLVCKESLLSAPFSAQHPKLQEFYLKFPASDLSLGCPNLTKMTLDCAKLPVLDLDKFPRGLVSLSATNCEVEQISGSFESLEKLESVCLSYNKLAGYLAGNTLELPSSVVILELCRNKVIDMAGVRIGNRMDVVNVSENVDITWQALGTLCEQMRPRQGIVYASLRDTEELLHDQNSQDLGTQDNEAPMREEDAERNERLREYIDEQLLKVQWE